MTRLYVPDQSAALHSLDPARHNKPQAVITLEAWQQLQTYVRLCAVEINGFGLVTLLPGNIFLIDKVLITEQVVSAGSAEANDANMHRVMHQMIVDGDDFERLRCQWHSHVGGATRFSNVDMATIERFQADWWISLLLNQYGHISCRYDQFQPLGGIGIYMPLQVLVPGPSEDMVRTIAAEMEEKVEVLPKMEYDAEQNDWVPVLVNGEPDVPPLFVNPNFASVVGQILPLPVGNLVPVS